MLHNYVIINDSNVIITDRELCKLLSVTIIIRIIPNTVKPLSIVPGSVVQYLWSLSESYFNYGSHIYCFPGSIISFSDPQQKR
jgi:hypothetical protein